MKKKLPITKNKDVVVYTFNYVKVRENRMGTHTA